MLKCTAIVKRDRNGVAAVEFALLAPMILLLLLAVVEYSKFTMVDRRAGLAAQMLAEYLSRDPDNFQTRDERHQAQDIWMIANPTADGANEFSDSGWQRGYSFGWASAEFVPRDPTCTNATCEFDPEVNWVFHLPFGTQKQVKTSCNLETVPNSTPLDGTNVPIGIAGRAAIVMVDIVYPYQPLVGGQLIAHQERHVNAIRKTRSSSPLEHFTLRANYMTWCP